MFIRIPKPEKSTKLLGLGQIFGDDQVLNHVNAQATRSIIFEQKKAFEDILPFGLIGSAINALIVFVSFAGSADLLHLLPWISFMLIISCVGARSGFIALRHKGSKPVPKSIRLNRPLYECSILAFAWALAPILLLPDASASQYALLMTVCAGMLAGGAFTLSAVPRAATAFICIMAVGCVVGLVIRGDIPSGLGIMMLITLYSYIMIRSVIWNFARYMSIWRQSIEAEQKSLELANQRDVISVLLRDFEASSSDALWQFDEHGQLFDPTSALAKLSGVTIEKLQDITTFDLIKMANLVEKEGLLVLMGYLEARKGFSDHRILLQKDGEERCWSLTGKPVFRNKLYTGFRGVVSDLTDVYQAEKRIEQLAHYDALTGLPNRALYSETLERCHIRMERDGDPYCLIALDLDLFKSVNDVYGHDMGDKLLQRVADLLKVKTADKGISARIGGDEFAIILFDVDTRETVEQFCNDLIGELSAPFHIQNIPLQIGGSAGIAFCPEDAEETSDLLKCSDLALYRAKELGRGQVSFFDKELGLAAEQSRKLELDLELAFQEKQFQPYYQPILSTKSDKKIGYEAFIRWNHPELGLVQSETFIEMIERTGWILEIGERIILQILEDVSKWDGNPIVSINLSDKQVLSDGLLPAVTNALARSKAVPERVQFEIKASTFQNNPILALRQIQKLKALGCLIALDDFGIDGSSLDSLRQFQFDTIKLDKAFVHDIGKNYKTDAIIKSLLHLSDQLGIRVTAEGVETSEQAEMLTEAGCHELQGHYIGSPETAGELI